MLLKNTQVKQGISKEMKNYYENKTVTEKKLCRIVKAILRQKILLNIEYHKRQKYKVNYPHFLTRNQNKKNNKNVKHRKKITNTTEEIKIKCK